MGSAHSAATANAPDGWTHAVTSRPATREDSDPRDGPQAVEGASQGIRPARPAALPLDGDEPMIEVPTVDRDDKERVLEVTGVNDLSWSIDRDVLASHAAFLERCGTTPFDTAAWIDACKAAAPDRSYAFVTATDRRGAMAAFFPFAKRNLMGMGLMTWAAQDWADYCMPTLDPAILPDITTADAEALLARAIAVSGLTPDVLCLRKQPATTAGRPNAFFALAGRQLESDSGHYLQVGAEWPTLLKEKVSKRSRQLVRRKRRALESLGALDFARPGNEAQATSWAKLMIAWKRTQVGQRGGTDHFADPAGLQVIEASIRSKAGRIFALTLDEKPIAICYTIEAETPAGPTRLLYQTAIDMDGPTAASPGVLLLHELLETSCRDGFEYFDFGMGDEAYKAQWVETSFALGAVHRAMTAKGLPVALLLKGASLARRTVKSRPALFAQITAIRARARAVLRR